MVYGINAGAEWFWTLRYGGYVDANTAPTTPVGD
jgi:hypothetical protein